MKKFLAVTSFVAIAGLLIALSVVRKGKIGEQCRIAVIPKGTTYVFWQSVRAGTEQAGAESGVKIFWNGPELETDREKQIQIIEDFIVQKVDGVVLAPLDSKALIPSPIGPRKGKLALNRAGIIC